MLKIGVPSKGRLMEKTFDWFGARGVTMRQTGNDREYSGAVEGIDGVELVLLSAGEIPRELSAGRIHLGVTGSDLVRDKLADWPAQVAELAPLGFGHADLIIAVPVTWIDVDTLDDLDAAASAFRAAHGHRLRIATGGKGGDDRADGLTRGFFDLGAVVFNDTGRRRVGLRKRRNRHQRQQHGKKGGECGAHGWALLLGESEGGRGIPSHPADQ